MTAMGGRQLVAALGSARAPARPPFVPILGRIAAALTQTPWDEFTEEPQAHAMAVNEVATAMCADAVTIGVGTRSTVAIDAVRRLTPLLKGRALAVALEDADVSAVRSLCEAGADMILLLRPDREDAARLRTIANVCGFYQRPVILVDPSVSDTAEEALRLGLSGAVCASPTGAEPGIVGGGLGAGTLGVVGAPRPPRGERFFWSFAAEVPEDVEPEHLAALGLALTE